MILNEVELDVSQNALRELKEMSDALKSDESWLVEAQIESLKEQIEKLNQEIETYLQLKAGNFNTQREINVAELPRYLISARIAKQVTQDQLAAKLRIPSGELRSLESGMYSGASLTRVLNVAQGLDLAISKLTDFNGEVLFEDAENLNVDWASFPIKEMVKRGWVTGGKTGELIESVKSFVQDAFGASLAPALHRKTNFAGRKAHEVSLIAWQARVLSQAEEQLRLKVFPPFEYNDKWLPELVALSKLEDGPLQAQAFLAKKGIVLVYEPHLEGTYLDGAAMLSENGTPVIGVTIRHDRIDNFWFVLMHELGHVFLHLSNMGKSFIDENVGEGQSLLEDEADEFALDNLIPPAKWKVAVVKVMETAQALEGDAQRMNVHPAIVAGRYRRETENYRVFNEVVGYGKVRSLFV